jgi:hypothetical protein
VNWTFLASPARALRCIARDPGVRLRDIAARAGITERSAYGTATGPAEAGYEVKQQNRRRNRYQTRAHLPLPEPGSQERTAGDVLALLAGTPHSARHQPITRQRSLIPWRSAMPVRVGAGRTGMAERLGYASQSCFLAAGLAARARRLCVRAAGLARRMSARCARAGQRLQGLRHLQA